MYNNQRSEENVRSTAYSDSSTSGVTTRHSGIQHRQRKRSCPKSAPAMSFIISLLSTIRGANTTHGQSCSWFVFALIKRTHVVFHFKANAKILFFVDFHFLQITHQTQKSTTGIILYGDMGWVHYNMQRSIKKKFDRRKRRGGDVGFCWWWSVCSLLWSRTTSSTLRMTGFAKDWLYSIT